MRVCKVLISIIRYGHFCNDSPASCAEIPERDGLLGRQINDNKAIDTCLFTVLQQSLLAVAQDRVVVSHKQDWSSQSLLACLSNHLEDRGDRDSIDEGLLYIL
jgi:hypothetical protein